MENKKVKISDLRQVKGIGTKTIERIKEQFDKSEYVSRYKPDIHIEPNSLIHGNMLEVMNGVPDKSIDMILTDLPYGTTACSWDSIIPFDKMWKQYNRVIKDNGAIVLFGSEPFSSHLRMSNIEEYKYDWVWDKVSKANFLNANRQPLRQTEDILVFYTNQALYKPIMETKGDPRSKGGYITRRGDGDGCYGRFEDHITFNNTYYPSNLIQFSNASQSDKHHPTQKPVSLLKYLIKTYTNESDIVLDSTMGSGSTCVAAKKLGRKYIGIELDEEYFKVAKKRVAEVE